MSVPPSGNEGEPGWDKPAANLAAVARTLCEWDPNLPKYLRLERTAVGLWTRSRDFEPYDREWSVQIAGAYTYERIQALARLLRERLGSKGHVWLAPLDEDGKPLTYFDVEDDVVSRG